MMEVNKYGFLRFSKNLKNNPQNRQSAPIVYQLNGLFVLNVKQFMKYKIFYMPKTLPFEIPPERGIMIDTEFEFQTANMIATKKIKI
jgi:CMP-N-acetylneuraminic acid synthetase